MKKILSFFIIIWSSYNYGQIQHLYSNWDSSTQTYDSPQLFTSKAISEDYGPRPKGSYDFHGGIDIGLDSSTNPSILSDAIVAPMSGEVIFIDDTGVKNILVKFSNQEYVVYRHIFEGGSAGQQQSGGFVMKTTNNGNLSIINITSDPIRAISKVDGDLVSYDLNNNGTIETNETFVTERTFNQFQLIAPVGNSVGFAPHIHIQSVKELKDSSGNVTTDIDSVNESHTFNDDINTFNPLFDFDYTGISYSIIMNDFMSLNQSSYVKIRVEVPEEHRTSLVKRYEDGMFDVQNISLKISPFNEDSFLKMKKSDANFIEFDFGSKFNNFYPEEMAQTSEVFGKWKITPTAYWEGSTVDYGLYDDYYLSLTDFNSRALDPNIQDVDNNGLADISSECMYGDGIYTMKAVLEPVEERNPFFYSNIGPFESSVSDQFIIDNFRPYVERVLIIFSLNDVYNKEWQRNGDVMELVGSNQGVTFEDGDEFHVRIFSSEPLEELNLQVEDIDGIFALSPNDSKTQWDIDLLYTGPTIQRDLILTGLDTNSNELLKGENIPNLNNHLISSGSSGRLLDDNLTGEDRTHKINVIDPCNITANAGTNVTIQNGDSTTLQGFGGTSCSWSPTTGLSNPNICTTTASPTQTTTYTLTVTENGCTDTDTVTVTVDGSGGGNPPANDDCSNAITLTSSTSCNYSTGTVEDTTPSFGANNCLGCSCTSPDDYDVYYKFTAVETSHTVTVSNYASNFDAVLELRAACSSGSSNYISCYDPTGAPTSVSETWTGLTVGQTYYIRVFEWSYQQSPPNSGTFDICVTHQNSNSDGIDLISDITSVSNDNPDTGDTITINYTGSNIGDEPTTTLPTISFYLSTNTTLSGADDFLSSEIILQTISVNETVNGDIEVSIPNVSDGQYYLVSSIDNLELIDESDEDNNVSFYAIQIGDLVPNGPDLDVRDVDVIPNSNLIPGQEVDIEVRIENEGTEDVGSFTVLVYFDINGNNGYDGGNEYMGEFAFNSLDAGDDETMVVDFDLPVEIYTTGNYEIFAIADSDNAINETNENNNDDDQNVTIGYVYDGVNDDVRVIDETIDLTNVNAGSDVFVTSNHIYLGSQSDSNVPTLDLGYYLSTDCALSSDDIFLDDDSSGIGNDDPIKFEDQTLTIPPATPTGTYYILFVADMNNEVNEGALENNNVVCIEISVTNSNGANGDVYIADEICNPTDVIIGSEIEPYINVHYTGTLTNAELPSVAVYYYLSNDCTLSTDDILVSDDSISLGSDLPINDASDAIELPDNLSPGIYYIIFQADAENVVFETDENNNIACAQFNLLPANTNYQDVTFNSPYVAVTEATFGDQVHASIHQNYTGYQADADIASIRMEYYLSTDCTLSADDYYFTDDYSSLGSDDPSQFEFATLTIPTNISTGDYYILFVADSENNIVENNENNNTECVPITITETLGIEDNELVNKIKVYPNPVNDILTINLGEAYSKINLEIYTVIGQKINSLKYENKQIISVNTSYLSNGIYFLNIKADSIKLAGFKIIKE